MLDNQNVIAVLEAIGAAVEAHKEYLTELDQPIGDSDHGINLARGFQAVSSRLPGMAGADIGTIFKNVGMTLVSTVGGASGPLYGTAFMRMGMTVGNTQELSMDGFLKGLESAVEGVKQRGHSTVEEATMLDAMVPALEAMKAAAADGKDPKAVLEAGCQASWAGAEHTKDLVATKGRASYVGERGLGHQDPGATSFSYLLDAVRENL